jgi:hypothetical protein
MFYTAWFVLTLGYALFPRVLRDGMVPTPIVLTTYGILILVHVVLVPALYIHHLRKERLLQDLSGVVLQLEWLMKAFERSGHRSELDKLGIPEILHQAERELELSRKVFSEIRLRDYRERISRVRAIVAEVRAVRENSGSVSKGQTICCGKSC